MIQYKFPNTEIEYKILHKGHDLYCMGDEQMKEIQQNPPKQFVLCWESATPFHPEGYVCENVVANMPDRRELRYNGGEYAHKTDPRSDALKSYMECMSRPEPVEEKIKVVKRKPGANFEMLEK